MATFYLRTRTSRASAARGAAHANYIAGNDRYAHKNEVIAVIDRNLPSWAKTLATSSKSRTPRNGSTDVLIDP